MATWTVFDLNARGNDADGKPVRRTHEPVKNVHYSLSASVGTEMEEAHARVFLRDDAFLVRNQNGEEVPSLQKEQMGRKPPEFLDPGMVVAKLAELTTDALLTRASTYVGGTDFPPETDRDALIEFIERAQTPRVVGDDDADLTEGDPTMRVRPAMMDKLIPRKSVEQAAATAGKSLDF